MKSGKGRKYLFDGLLAKMSYKVNSYLWERNLKKAATSIAKEDGISKKSIQYHHLLRDLANATNVR